MFNIGYDYLKNGLACERAWLEWIETLEPEPCHLNRYRRLNVPFDFEPTLDDIAAMETYRDKTRKEMVSKKDTLQQIAAQLISSCFFVHFQPDQWDREKMECTGRAQDLAETFLKILIFPGTIECRFPPKKDYTKSLGQYFQKLRIDGQKHRNDDNESTKQVPYFVVKETHQSPEHYPWIHDILQFTIDRMATEGIFKMPIQVEVSHELAETEISLALSKDQNGATLMSAFLRKIQRDYAGKQLSNVLTKVKTNTDSLRPRQE